MLTCKDVSQRATALVEGELGTWERMQIQMHLAMCKGCTAFIAQMRTTRNLIQAVPIESDEMAVTDDVDAILSKFHDQKQSGG